MYLLDTNACLDFLLARRPAIAPRIERAFGRLAVSSISAAELRVGNRKSMEPEEDARRVDLFLRRVDVQPFDQAAALSYAGVVRALGIERSSFDRLIAAHALSLNLILITNNTCDFADLPGLRVENWTAT